MKDQIGSFFYFPSLAFHKAAGGFGSIKILSRPRIPVPFDNPADDFSVLIGDWYTSNHTVSLSLLMVISLVPILYRLCRLLHVLIMYICVMQVLQGILDGGNKLPLADGILINGRGPNATSFTVQNGITSFVQLSCTRPLQIYLYYH